MALESQQALVNRILATRREMRSEEVTKTSSIIERRLLLMSEFRVSQKVGIYADVDHEVQTDLIFAEARVLRKEIYYPMIDAASDQLKFLRVLDLSEIKRGERGLEVKGAQRWLRDLGTLDAVLVPGVAFDLNGCRIGSGEGRYNLFLETFAGKRIGLAYEFQVVSGLPVSARGRKVDWIVTESRIIRCQ